MALFSGWSPLVSSPGLFSPRYGGLNVSELGGDVNGDEEDASPAFTSPGEAIVIGTNEGDVITMVGEVVMETTDVDDELPSSEPPSRNLWVIWCCFMFPCNRAVRSGTWITDIPANTHFCSETFPAVLALERPFLGVAPHVVVMCVRRV